MQNGQALSSHNPVGNLRFVPSTSSTDDFQANFYAMQIQKFKYFSDDSLPNFFASNFWDKRSAENGKDDFHEQV